jgi:hypothetical protein
MGVATSVEADLALPERSCQRRPGVDYRELLESEALIFLGFESQKDETPAVWPASQERLRRDRSGVFPSIVPPSPSKVQGRLRV